MFYDTRNEYFIFFFGILFVENTIGFVAETDASEAVNTIITLIEIEVILRSPTPN